MKKLFKNIKTWIWCKFQIIKMKYKIWKTWNRTIPEIKKMGIKGVESYYDYHKWITGIDYHKKGILKFKDMLDHYIKYMEDGKTSLRDTCFNPLCVKPEEPIKKKTTKKKTTKKKITTKKEKK